MHNIICAILLLATIVYYELSSPVDQVVTRTCCLGNETLADTLDVVTYFCSSEDVTLVSTTIDGTRIICMIVFALGMVVKRTIIIGPYDDINCELFCVVVLMFVFVANTFWFFYIRGSSIQCANSYNPTAIGFMWNTFTLETTMFMLPISIMCIIIVGGVLYGAWMALVAYVKWMFCIPLTEPTTSIEIYNPTESSSHVPDQSVVLTMSIIDDITLPRTHSNILEDAPPEYTNVDVDSSPPTYTDKSTDRSNSNTACDHRSEYPIESYI